MVGENVILLEKATCELLCRNLPQTDGCGELKVHIQSKFKILFGVKKEAVPLIHFIFFLN